MQISCNVNPMNILFIQTFSWGWALLLCVSFFSPHFMSKNIYLTKIMHESHFVVPCSCICKLEETIQSKPNCSTSCSSMVQSITKRKNGLHNSFQLNWIPNLKYKQATVHYRSMNEGLLSIENIQTYNLPLRMQSLQYSDPF